NAFRVGYARLQHKYVGLDTQTGETAASLGLNTGVTDNLSRNGGFPQVFTISGFSAIGSRNTQIEGPNSSTEFNHQVSYLRGNHSLKFGGTFMTGYQNGGTWANTKGTLTFGQTASGSNAASGLVAFLAGENTIPSATIGGVPINAKAGDVGLRSASLFYGNPESHLTRP